MSLSTLPDGAGEERTVTATASLKARIFTLAVNFLVLGELCVAMFFAARNPEKLTETFFAVFGSMLLPTILFAIIGKKFFVKAPKR